MSRPPSNPYIRILRPGDAMVITRVPVKRLHEQCTHLRRSRGVNLTVKKLDGAVEIRRNA